MTLVILVPMLGRPHRVAPLLDTIRATCTARVLFLTTPGDAAVTAAIEAAGAEQLPVEWHPYGDYARKINRGIAVTTEAHIFTAADDVAFHPGWYEAAAALLVDPVGVVGTNDRCNRRVTRGEHGTHFLVSRFYVERFGTVDEPGKFMHEGYPHEYVDDEVVETAKKRRAWASARASVVEHLHPMVGKAPMDDLYAAQGARMREGLKVYQQRRHLWR